ncbi:hypothetical protein B0H19DRAFT_1043543 [Mycena capillaripes]|nr:hypothetical protein B0H19DRAFT_1043543 [Mycena capillaripes]
MASLEDVDRKPIILPPGANLPVGEYEAGRVICEVCGGGVSFRDDAGGGMFTLKHWEAHRLTWFHPHPGGGLLYTPPTPTSHSDMHHAHGMPPAKRRRAKRTEEERIEYLRADAHVAQFEAYRVLCASCDKWIRLRPNSTYCSIPWDAHRKSCLAKKSNAKNAYALEERNAMFAKDPDVRKFDAERILCGMCDKWLSTPTDDHLAAVQVWNQHRAACQKTVSALKNHPQQGHPHAQHPHAQSHPQPHPHSAPPSHAARPIHPNSHPNHLPLTHPPPAAPTHLPHPDAPHLVLDLSPTNYAAPHESRRRNAEQRAATLRADVLIREVEPNRVFCSLCTKWVQLRQDSSYCAYPWLQHRGKCLARYQRRAQKASEIASLKSKRPIAGAGARGGVGGEDQHQHPSEDGDEPESEEGVSESAKHRHAHWAASQQQAQSQQQIQGEDVDAEGEADDVDADGDSYMEDDGASATPTRAYGAGTNGGAYGNGNGNGANTILRRAVPASLADLDSPGGRRAFVFASVEYLFRTTYEASDDMSVSALLTYLNAAMPMDKHEDFDTGEVVRAASAFAAREKDRFVLEGDMLRLLHESG